MTKYFANPVVRLAGRAIIAGIAVGFTALQAADDPFSSAALYAAGGAAFLAAVEVFTPLNGIVGWLKQAPTEPR